MTVGIPGAFERHEGLRYWESLLTMLGCGMIISSPALLKALSLGAGCLGEACPAVQAKAGQLLSISNQADILLLPRSSCPSAAHLFENIPKLPGCEGRILIVDEIPCGSKTETEALASMLGINANLVRQAFLRARQNRKRAQMEAADLEPSVEQPAVALLGPPCLVNNSGLNHDIKRKLKGLGYSTVTLAFSKVDDLSPFVRGAVMLTAQKCELSTFQPDITLSTFAGNLPCLVLNIGSFVNRKAEDKRIRSFAELLDFRHMGTNHNP